MPRTRRNSSTTFFRQFLGLSTGMLALLTGGATAQTPPLSDKFGFLPLEVHKLDDRSANLLVGDFNADGRNDLAVADNSRSRIELLLQQARLQPEPLPVTAGVNGLRNSGRFEIRPISVDHEIAALTSGDFDGDGRLDLAYVGRPDQVGILLQGADNDWTEKLVLRVPGIAAAPWCVTAGKLTEKGPTSLVVLGQAETLIFTPRSRKDLGPPQRLLNTSDKPSMIQLSDVDGDGRPDLVYLAGDATNRQLCARFAESDQSFTPEYVFNLERPRAVTLRNVDGQSGDEILTIDARTGRISVKQIRRQALKADELPEQLVYFGLGKPGSTRARELALGDVEGDGRTDVIAADPESSQLLLFPQSAKAGLELGQGFPSLAEIDRLLAADLNGDGRSELLLHSATEKTLGIAHWEADRLTFPKPLSVEGTVAGCAIAELNGDNSSPELAILTSDGSPRRSEVKLTVLSRNSAGAWAADRRLSLDSLGLTGTVDRLLAADMTGDGLTELVIFQSGSQPPRVYSVQDDKLKELATPGSVPLPAVTGSAASLGLWQKQPALFLAQNNFLRVMALDADKKWVVREQINSSEASSRIVGGTLLQLDGASGPEVALIDAGSKRLKVLHQGEGTFQTRKEYDLGEFSYKGNFVADLNGDGREDLLLLAADRFAVLFAGGSTPLLRELATYESTLERMYPTDLLAGDLNHDGTIDLAVTDTRAHFLEILDYEPAEKSLRHALYFRVFEEKTINSQATITTEPREGLIADITGDGFDDLILLVHDRLLVYPQDPGKKSP